MTMRDLLDFYTNAPLLDVFPYLGLPGGGYQTEPGTTKAS